jgi:hypothetical protein
MDTDVLEKNRDIGENYGKSIIVMQPTAQKPGSS